MAFSSSLGTFTEALNKLSPEYRREQEWKKAARGMEVQKFASQMRANRAANEKAEREASIRKRWDTMNEIEDAYLQLQEIQDQADPAAPGAATTAAKDFMGTLSPEAQEVLAQIQSPEDYNDFVSEKSRAELRMAAEGLIDLPEPKDRSTVKVLTNTGPDSEAAKLGIPLNESARVRFNNDDNAVEVLGRFAKTSTPTDDESVVVVYSNTDGSPTKTKAANMGIPPGESARVKEDKNGNGIAVLGRFAVDRAGDDEREEINAGDWGATESVVPVNLQGQDIIELSTGMGSSTWGALEKLDPTSGLVKGGPEVSARQFMSGIQKALETGYINNPRVPVGERQQLEALELTDVSGGFFQSASGTRSKLTTALPLLERQYAAEIAIANHPAATAKMQSDSQAAARNLSRAITDIETALASGKREAPSTALQYLEQNKNDPSVIKQFKDFYGYLPEGY